METTRQEYDRLTGMSEELARMQREFIVKMLKQNGNRLEIDRDSDNYDHQEAQLEAETEFGAEMVDVDYLRYDEESGRIYWGGLYNGEDIYRVAATESGRMPDFDEIHPGTAVRVTGRIRMDRQTIAAHNIEII